MRYAKLVLYFFFLAVIIHFTIYLATDYQTFPGRNHTPFAMWTIDTIDLFIHEAGHLVFRLFGQVLYFMGGSLFQVIIPIVTAVVFGRNNLRSLMFTLYWIGQSMANVSIYIGDAPYQQLHLLSRHALHDWHWLMVELNLMDDIETIASVVNVIGILTCVAGIGVGLFFIGMDGYRLFTGQEPTPTPKQFFSND
jgi:hypothetical protein